MKMIIKLKNPVFDGKYQSIYFAILDLNDFLGRPITFDLVGDITIKNFNIDTTNWNKRSSRYVFIKKIVDTIEKIKAEIEEAK